MCVFMAIKIGYALRSMSPSVYSSRIKTDKTLGAI